MREGYQIHPDLFRYLSSLDELSLKVQFERIRRIIEEKKRSGEKEVVLRIEDIAKEEEEKRPIEVHFNVIFDSSKHINPTGNFNSLFINRFEKLREIWSFRTGPKELTEIMLVKRMRYQRPRLIGGLVTERRFENSKFYIKVEDLTGEIEVEVPKTHFSEIEEVIDDVFLVLEIEHGEEGFIAKNVIFLDVPSKKLRTTEEDLYVAVLSDLHLGSPKFERELFLEVLNWLAKPDGRIKDRLCCVFFLGDIISSSEGGSIRDLYSEFFKYLKILPPSLHKVIIPGEDDATRLALPQPAISSYYLVGSGNIANLHLLGNPSYVSVNGVKFLCYHGQSLDDVASQVPFSTSVEPARLGRILLKHRHLAPIYGSSTPIAPEKEDLLVVSDVPDVFLIGHVHYPSEDFYKNVLIVTASSLTMDARTEGGRLLLLNLRNLETSWIF